MLNQLSLFFKPAEKHQEKTLPEYHVVKKKRKRLSLSVKPDLSVWVSVPLRTTQREIKDFVNRNQAWIKERKARLSSKFHLSQLRFTGDETIPILGRNYRLKCVNAAKASLEFEQQQLVFNVPTDLKLENYPALFTQKLRAYAEIKFSIVYKGCLAQVDFLNKQGAPSLVIKPLKSQWGNYHKVKHQVTLSSYLLHYPLPCLQSVIYHELCHTQYFGHGKNFYQLLSQIMPQWKKADKILKGKT